MNKLSVTFVALITAGLMQSAFAEQPIVIKFSHVLATNTPKGKAAEYFKKLAEERTQGRVKVEIYPNSILYKDKEEVEALQLGAVQMLAPALSKFGPLGVREFEIFDLPYLFDNYAQLNRVTRGSIGAGLLKKLESKGIIGLAYWHNGFKQLSANKPLKVPADARGLKLRIPSSRLLDAQMRAIGAIPQTMAFAEVYQAFQTGVVDGGENTYSNMFTAKHYEVQKFITQTDHGYLGYAVIANKKFWEELPLDVRETLEQALEEATKYGNGIAQKENDEALAAIRTSGKTTVITLTPAERLIWKKAMVSVHSTASERFGSDVLDQIYKQTGWTR